ncbi:MAG: cation diffusion facilitator family transporter [Conexivisphaerales archaeon]
MDNRRPVITALIANLVITVVKLFVGVFSRSTAVLAETVHSLSDTVNQLLLLAGVELSTRPPTPKHPFGRGKEQFFWSFVAAISVFTVSAVFSLYRGAEELFRPTPPENIYASIAILASVALLEGYALSVTYRNIAVRADHMRVKGITGFFRVSKDSIILTAFLEDVVAIAGVAIAIAGLYLSNIFNTGFYDALASIAIGLMLAGYAVVVAVESRDLLLGEGMSKEEVSKAKSIITSLNGVDQVLDIRGVYFGPGKVVLGIDVSFNPNLRTSEIERITDEIEKRLKLEFPQVQYIYIEAETPERVPLARKKEGEKI